MGGDRRARERAALQRRYGRRSAWSRPCSTTSARTSSAYARDFHDITVGSNALDLRRSASRRRDFGFSAGPGYDLPTGLGTPNVSNLLADLATRGSGEIPGNLFHGNKGGGGKDKGKGPKHHRFDPSR